MQTKTEFYQGDHVSFRAKLDSGGTSYWFTLELTLADPAYGSAPVELTFFRSSPANTRRVVFELISELLKCLEENVE